MTTEKEQLEAEIAKRDARIAGLVGVRDHLRLQASIQAQEARTQKAIVAEIGAMVGEPCDWLTASAVREALKAQQPSAGGVDERAAFDAWFDQFGVGSALYPESTWQGWQARARLNPCRAQAVACVACEGHPMGVNNPCAVCGGAQAVPDGYVLVPVDPTPEMISASLKTAACMSQADPDDIERAIWHNMLAAAPSAQQKEG